MRYKKFNIYDEHIGHERFWECSNYAEQINKMVNPDVGNLL